MRLFGKTKLATKIISLPILISVLMGMVFVYLIPYMHDRLFSEKELKTRHVVETAASLIEHYAALEKAGKMTRAQAQAAAMAAVKGMRYEKKDYFWINDFGPKMVMHPIKPKLDGKDLSGMADVNGKKLFMEMVKVARDKGAGMVDYYWPKPGQEQAQPKISYIQSIPQWGWIVGSGIYVDDVSKEIMGIVYRISGIVGSIFIISVLLSLVLARTITKPLDRAIKVLNEGSSQISLASSNVASASQDLAMANSQQAASLEETSASLEEMSSMTKKNAENASEANGMMEQNKTVVEAAGKSMEEMNQSMNSINAASEQVVKIIKTIDEIAFQTNLLALNAAVEAARAGEHGSGFAVVAEEVRSLAQRAADAAKNTQELIKNTLTQVKSGSDIVERTNTEFQELSTSSLKVAELVGEIAAASGEQAQGIDQINNAVAEMDRVVQSNAASAEESAAASEEMNAQAKGVRQVVTDLMDLIGGQAGGAGDAQPPKRLPYKKKDEEKLKAEGFTD